MQGVVAEGRLELMQVYKLLQSVREEDMSLIRKMARMGVPNLINLTEPQEGLGALHQAAEANNASMVNFLLNQGAVPDLQDKRGRTAAMRAAELGYHAIVELLGNNGADMKAVDLEGRGVLFYCIHPTEAHLHCLKVALSSGADVNNISHTGKPVLVLACENAEDCEEMCIDLLEKGADPENADKETGRTPLMEASKVGALDVVRLILQDYLKVNDLDNNLCHAAHFAAEGGFLEVIQVLSAYSADLGMVSADGSTPLHLAAKGGFANCCKFLSQRGCNPKLKDKEGLIPRLIAKNLNHKGVMKELKKAETLYGKYVEGGEANPNELWALTFHDWSDEHEERLRVSFNMEEGEDIGKGKDKDKDMGEDKCKDQYKDRYEYKDRDKDKDKLRAPVDVISKNTFMIVMADSGAPVDAEKLEKIFAAHDKKRLDKMNVSDFFKGLEYLEKAFVATSYSPKTKKGVKGEKGKKKKGKFTIPFPICTVPADLVQRRSNGGPPQYMIERYHCLTDPKRFSREHPPAHPILDDSAWYMDEPEKAYVNINHCVKRGDLESLSLALSQSMPVDVRDGGYQDAPHDRLQQRRLPGGQVPHRRRFKWTPLHHACHMGQAAIIQLLLSEGADVDAVAMNGTTPLMKAIVSCRTGCVELLFNAGADLKAKNNSEQNCLDIAKAYGDVRIVELVKSKYDDPDYARKDSMKGQPDYPQKTPSLDEISTPSSFMSRGLELNKMTQKYTVEFRKACVKSGAADKLDITYVPRKMWGPPIPKKKGRKKIRPSRVDLEEATTSRSAA
ncbi:hypothetical protein AAFF_G00069490 [Aldrovandia affinis]|uniref:Uncharacterized protein n=1 Tax=Aldrovandia affinis TaxID=143900 RepID=A0AAD7WDY0_9TELE|nr:hypothetical protein AAFF_G00069490 [Aldrovandia affinis]